jgi:hypothetical protein
LRHEGTVNVGDRVFDIAIQGRLVRQNYDIIREAGATLTGVRLPPTGGP